MLDNVFYIFKVTFYNNIAQARSQCAKNLVKRSDFFYISECYDFYVKSSKKSFPGIDFYLFHKYFWSGLFFTFLTCRMLLLWQQKPISDCTKTNIFLNAQQNCLMTLFWRESSIFSSIYCVVFFSFFILSEKRIVSFFLCSGANLLI